MNCPCCGGALGVIGSRARSYVDESGNKCKVSIRRLRCKGCGRIHHELPDILIPYKRHCAQTVERIVDDGAVVACCEDSTIRRIRRWFNVRADYFLWCMEAAAAQMKPVVTGGAEYVGDVRPPPKLQRVRTGLGNRLGWLRSLVRAIANRNLWPHTRSAYCPR